MTTASEINEMLRAEKYGLSAAYLRNDYIYLVNNRGEAQTSKGIKGGINEDVDAPYAVCTVHNSESWAEFLKTNPLDPEDPDNPTGPNWPVIPEGG